VSGRLPSAIAGAMFDEIVERFGDPSRTWRFEAPPDARDVPDAIDVFAWDATPQVRITNLATVGMCDRPMVGAGHRAELHFAVRGELGAPDLERAAALLADLAAFPFLTGRALDWWHTIARFGPFPGYSGCSAVLLHPAFAHGGWDRVDSGGVVVRILNVVPITDDEMATARERGVGALMERFARDDVDLLRDR